MAMKLKEEAIEKFLKDEGLDVEALKKEAELGEKKLEQLDRRVQSARSRKTVLSGPSSFRVGS